MNDDDKARALIEGAMQGTPIRVFAGLLFDLFGEFKEAGFSPDEALTLTNTNMMLMLTGQIKTAEEE